MVTAEAAEANFLELLEQVVASGEITIIKDGVPVAILKPYIVEKDVETETVVRQPLEFQENQSLSGSTVRQMIEDGKR